MWGRLKFKLVYSAMKKNQVNCLKDKVLPFTYCHLKFLKQKWIPVHSYVVPHVKKYLFQLHVVLRSRPIFFFMLVYIFCFEGHNYFSLIHFLRTGLWIQIRMDPLRFLIQEGKCFK